MTKIKKIICPRCTGNGYVRIPNEAVGVSKEIIAQCTMCDSEGEIDEVNCPDDVNTNDRLQ
jgi:DnaJ-class molecular chaperone|tara:strand:- start:136 stop:318 length:183 start_codon:yes stop_codon:yes gene_type:complete